MSTKINLTYYGMPGSGATVKEAKLDAGRRIEEALRRPLSPILLRWRGTLLVIMPEAHQGYGYRMYSEAEIQPVLRTDPCSVGYATREEALQSAVFHLSDVTRVSGEPVECQRPLYEAAFAGRDLERHWAEFVRRAESSDRFSARYQFAKERGLDDSEAHSFALGRPGDEHLHVEQAWEIWQAAAAERIGL